MVTVVLLPGHGSTLTQAKHVGQCLGLRLDLHGCCGLAWRELDFGLPLVISLPSLLEAAALCSLSISEASALSLGVILALLLLVTTERRPVEQRGI